jgi:hypothetical protein
MWHSGDWEERELDIPIVKGVTKDTLLDYETTTISDIKSLGVEVANEAEKDVKAVKNAFNDVFSYAKYIPFVVVGVGFLYLQGLKKVLK